MIQNQIIARFAADECALPKLHIRVEHIATALGSQADLVYVMCFFPVIEYQLHTLDASFPKSVSSRRNAHSLEMYQTNVDPVETVERHRS